ncbi:type I restriction enzyme, S subunit [Prevotellaceae bacterium HUN156]|nr:type I restriction enzyme, S subunit [Prevotellaceae bacterium HUN156]
MNAQQLRNSILQEAIEGRLVPQDPNDEPASVLLDRIRKEKLQLVKEGNLKKKDLVEKPISEDEIPFEVPESWEWVRLGALISYQNGYAYNSSETNKEGKGIPVIKSGNLMTLEVVLKRNNDFVEHPNDKMLASKIVKGDMLMCLSSQSDNPEPLGKTAIYKFDTFALLNQRVLKFRPYSDELTTFLFYTINSFYFWYNVSHQGGGSAQANLKLNHVLDMLVPFPPLAEQKRIVAKIEGLMPKVEEYGKAQEKLNKLNEELPERLKKSILQEAIEGRLVPQDSNDEPASALLAKIREEKKQLVKEGKLKKKDLEEKSISEDEIPFSIPDSWEWVRLGDIGIFERGNGIKRDETLDSGYPCVRYGEMYTKYRMAPTFDKTISFTSLSVFAKCRKAHCGDLFMALTGENKQDIALAAQYVGEDEVAVGGDLCHFTIITAYPLYFVYLINSCYFSSKKEVLATGDIIVHISTDKLASIPIPLPPCAEQKRIVEKIEQLFKEIDKLKTK